MEMTTEQQEEFAKIEGQFKNWYKCMSNAERAQFMKYASSFSTFQTSTKMAKENRDRIDSMLATLQQLDGKFSFERAHIQGKFDEHEKDGSIV